MMLTSLAEETPVTWMAWLFKVANNNKEANSVDLASVMIGLFCGQEAKCSETEETSLLEKSLKDKNKEATELAAWET
ncbi:hypothetical protein WICPIJ_000722 [Wickerhamomyces pijperi]|uniref:Uncharacterized protein n=1 Tax=Wickerhamomyces pijperi TaxID=599730 RepID=A0A9P8TQK8_WICPI|nr:hypothetical protein WICPIJ_000722 [Wickerhamomyces pijperi]